MIIGVDLGGTFMRMGRFDGGIVHDLKVVPASVFNTAGGAELLIEAIGEYCDASERRPEAIGIGVPGTVNLRGELVRLPNLSFLNGARLASMIEQRCRVSCFVENDVTMLLTGDSERMNLKKGIVFGMYIGSGLGGAIFSDGRLLRGRNGLCEPGHITIYGRTEPCACGKTGCAEAIVSGRALEALQAAKHPETHISELFTVMTDEEMDDYTGVLANTLAGVIQLLDPDDIVIGGGVPKMKGFPRADIETRVYGMLMSPIPASTLKIHYSADIEDSASAGSPGVYGAAVFAARKLGSR